MTIQALKDGRYDSISEFVHAAKSELVNTNNRAERDQFLTGSSHGKDWYGGFDAEGVQRVVLEGWPEGLERMAKAVSQIDASNLVPRDMRRRLYRGDMGDSLDIGAVYAGRWQSAWTRAKRQSAIAPQRIDVCVNMVCAGADDSSVLFWRGAAAVAFCDKMEAAGYMVRLVLGFGGDRKEVSCRITVKDYDKPLDICSSSTVILPGFFRSLGHAWVAGHARNTRPASMSVGECILDTGEIHISHTVKTEHSAVVWLEAQIAKINAQYETEAA